jgi:hypothetical protein
MPMGGGSDGTYATNGTYGTRASDKSHESIGCCNAFRQQTSDKEGGSFHDVDYWFWHEMRLLSGSRSALSR